MKRTALALTLILTLFVSSMMMQSAKSSSKTIIVPDDFPTIQTAVDNAFTGQAIFVRAGVYPEQHITIDKPLSLVGEDSENTILVGINNVKYSPPYVIQISADNVKVTGFTITNGSLGGIRVETVGSDIQPSGCVITGNNIINNAGGIGTYGGKALSISNNRISNNTDYGIYLATSQSNVFKNNITENGWAGIIIDSCDQVSVSNNNISGNGNQGNIREDQGGIILKWYGNFNVYANNITNNNGYGIQFSEGCNNSSVHDNNVKGNSVGVELFNFILTDNSEGIGIGTGSKVYRNNLDNSQNALVMTACPYNITYIYYAIGNGTDIVSWDNGIVGNYWSDYLTKYPNAAEIANSEFGKTPYLIDANNIDNHPLMKPVVIPELPDGTGETDSFPTTLLIATSVIIAISVLVLFFYIRKRKRNTYENSMKRNTL